MPTSQRGGVIWFTGLSGSGKTTLATLLADHLRPHRGVELLDGDVVRRALGQTGFRREDRLAHLAAMALRAAELEAQGVLVIGSFITPYEEARQSLRTTCRRYLEVWTDSPLACCETRDAKGLYAKARRGEIRHFTGIDDPFEVPQNFDIRLDTETSSVTESFQRLRNELTILWQDLKRPLE